MYAVTSSQMKELEDKCNRWGVDYRTLMENAGTAAAYLINETIPVAGRSCMVFCGRGNNGGDGLVAARVLHSLGGVVTVILVEGEPEAKLPQEMLGHVDALELPVLDFSLNRLQVEEELSRVDIIVDAIFGTGFRGALGETAGAACQAINDAIAAVFALDLPSGVEADDSNGDIDCVKADFTVVFDSLKPCHILPLTAGQCGNLCLVDIGIPDEVKADLSYRYAIVDERMVGELLKKRPEESHKGTFGKLLSITGSKSYPGAAVLSATGALRSGVGYVQLASVATVCTTVAGRMSEVAHLPLERNSHGRISGEALGTLTGAMGEASAILLGCGLGLDEDICSLVYGILRSATCPVILDGDGINALAQNINILNDISAPVILTPHLGELSRLLGLTVEEILQAPYELVGRFAKKYGVTVVCKSHKTFVVPGEVGVFLNTTGNSGLAKAGSGDLLAGIIAGLAAQGLAPHLAAACGVYLHGKAGDLAAGRLSQYFMQPTDVADCLADIFLGYGL